MRPDELVELRRILKRHEGTGPMRAGRFLLYPDTEGIWTAGYGRNMQDRGLSQTEAEFLLDNDLDNVDAALRSLFPWYAALDPVRRWALIDMGFMGPHKLLNFKKMNAALERGDYATATREALDSKWKTDIGPTRSGDVARMLETGEL